MSESNNNDVNTPNLERGFYITSSGEILCYNGKKNRGLFIFTTYDEKTHHYSPPEAFRSLRKINCLEAHILNLRKLADWIESFSSSSPPSQTQPK